MIKDRDIDILIANLLRYGVLTASTVVAVGGIFYLIHHGTDPVVDYSHFVGESQSFTTYEGILEGATSGRPTEIIQLGVLILIATPVLRVFCSLIAFVLERDKLYIFITFIVLGVMLSSIFGGIKL